MVPKAGVKPARPKAQPPQDFRPITVYIIDTEKHLRLVDAVKVFKLHDTGKR